MKKLLLFFSLFFVPYAMAANTATINGTIADSGGTTWTYASWQAVLVGTVNAHYKDGTPVVTSVSGYLSSGVISGTLGRNDMIAKPNTTWTFTICPYVSAPCQVVPGIVISSATVNVATVINPQLVPVSILSTGTPITAFTNSEISNPKNAPYNYVQPTSGQLYYNPVTDKYQYWSTATQTYVNFVTGNGITGNLTPTDCVPVSQSTTSINCTDSNGADLQYGNAVQLDYTYYTTHGFANYVGTPLSNTIEIWQARIKAMGTSGNNCAGGIYWLNTQTVITTPNSGCGYDFGLSTYSNANFFGVEVGNDGYYGFTNNNVPAVSPDTYISRESLGTIRIGKSPNTNDGSLDVGTIATVNATINNKQVCLSDGTNCPAVTTGQWLKSTSNCTANGSSYATCTNSVVNWPTAFPDTNYKVVCTGKGPSNGTGGAGSVSGDIFDYTKTTTGLTLALQTNTSSGFSYSEIDCYGSE